MPFLSVPNTDIISHNAINYVRYRPIIQTCNWYTAPLLINEPYNIAPDKATRFTTCSSHRHTILTFYEIIPFPEPAYHTVPPSIAPWPLAGWCARACFAGRRVWYLYSEEDIYGLKPNIWPISQLLATVVVDFHLIAPLRKHLRLF